MSKRVSHPCNKTVSFSGDTALKAALYRMSLELGVRQGDVMLAAVIIAFRDRLAPLLPDDYFAQYGSILNQMGRENHE